MRDAGATQLILEAGKSPDLKAAFQTVAETEVSGAPKFTERVCRYLERVITCRCYGPPILELSYLVVCAEACAGARNGFEAFFWASGPARPNVFQSYVARRLKPKTRYGPCVTAEQNGVAIELSDGHFTITYARMPFLSCLMEFLVTAIGYRELDDVWSDMLANGLSKQTVSATAKRLSKKVYGYLKDRLPTAQNQRRFARLFGFLEERDGGDFALESIDDHAVLEFWLDESPDKRSDGLDFRTFSLVFRSFVRLRQSLEEAWAQRGLDRPRTIGPDRKAGEVDPDKVLRVVEAVDDVENPLSRLRDAPASGIKFLTKTESSALELLVDCGKAALAMPLSLMRCEVFGAAQSRVTQALRRKRNSKGMTLVIDDSVSETYIQRQERYDHSRLHIERVLLASLHALTRARRPEVVVILRELRPDLDLQLLARVLAEPTSDDDKIVPMSKAAMAERLVAGLESPEVTGPGLAALMTESKLAFRSLSRRGFETAGPDELAGEGFADGAQALIDIERHLNAFCRRLGGLRLPHGDWAMQFDADHETFHNQFHLLYGGNQ